MAPLVGGFGCATSHNVARLVVVAEGSAAVGSVVLAAVFPLSCPGSGLGSLGVGLAQPTGCLLGFGVVVWSVPMLMVVLMVW